MNVSTLFVCVWMPCISPKLTHSRELFTKHFAPASFTHINTIHIIYFWYEKCNKLIRKENENKKITYKVICFTELGDSFNEFSFFFFGCYRYSRMSALQTTIGFTSEISIEIRSWHQHLTYQKSPSVGHLFLLFI